MQWIHKHGFSLFCIAAGIWFIAIAAVCPSLSASASDARIVEHEMGATKVEGTPERIVVLEFSFIDALASLGITPVGIADDGDPSRIIPAIREAIGSDWTSVGTRQQPSLEVISSLAPDLIIADLQRHASTYDALSRIAPTIVLPSLQATYQDNLDAMVTIGRALGRSAEVEARLAQHRRTMAALAQRVPENETRRFLAAVVWDQGFNAHTSAAYTSGVLESLGLTSAIQSAEPYANLNLEQLAQIDPDVMLLMVSGERTLVDEWQKNVIWRAFKAVRNGEIHRVDRNLWSRFRGIISAERIAKEAIDILYGPQ